MSVPKTKNELLKTIDMFIENDYDTLIITTKSGNTLKYLGSFFDYGIKNQYLVIKEIQNTDTYQIGKTSTILFSEIEAVTVITNGADFL